MKRVLDVGNCGADHAAICELIEANFAAVVDQADGREDALAALEAVDYDLVLVNRKLDLDGSDGADVIRDIKARSEGSSPPVMMITNYREHQQAAVAIGAVAGFGKNDLGEMTTVQRLRDYLA